MARGKKKIDYQGRARKKYIDAGYLVETVERKNCWTGLSNDFLGFGDFIAIKRGFPEPLSERVIVQASSGAAHVAHRNKILTVKRVLGSEDQLEEILCAQYALQCGFEIHLVTYSQKKSTGNKWIERFEEIKLSDFT